ncbi:hypothetical protein [Marinoscillum sp. MHG1-6]|uniref:hypothetical protein n=1 Tax=Marinoscillum sp. MHG1-6 TaxID=2959627 RepID=UPI002158798A|nr:hypothetical protein [Marinoscillum sp. MHG1-6]
MKKITQLLNALVICSLMVFASCGGDKKNDPGDARITAGENVKVVVANVSPISVTKDGVDRTEWDATKFTFTFEPSTLGGTFTVTGAPADTGADAVWASSGSWSFPGESAGTIDLDGKTATLSTSASTVSITFDVTGSGTGARAAAFDGEWVFTF